MTKGLDVPRGRHVGAWRALIALPAVIASAMLLLVMLGWAGRWEPLMMLAWLSCGLLSLTRWGERIAVRLGYRFRRASAAEQDALDRIMSQVLTRCGVEPSHIDVYVMHSNTMNAYATGRRSIAVTSRVLREHRAGRLDDQMLSGILAHEIGHHIAARVRFAPAIAWFSLPWRLASRVTLRISMRLAGTQPRGALALVAIATVTVAIVQSSQQRQWSNVVVLSALSAFTIIVPPTEAALSRAGERAADRYAAAVGYGRPLAHALRAMTGGLPPPGWTTAILASHPASGRRIDELAKSPS